MGENTIVFHSSFDNENDMFYVGQQLITEDINNNNVYIIEITSLEIKNKRVEETNIKYLKAVWCRSIDNIILKYSLQEKETTTSLSEYVSGDTIIKVGNYINIKNKEYLITCIKKRNGKFYKKYGEYLSAKDIKRVFIKKK